MLFLQASMITRPHWWHSAKLSPCSSKSRKQTPNEEMPFLLKIEILANFGVKAMWKQITFPNWMLINTNLYFHSFNWPSVRKSGLATVIFEGLIWGLIEMRVFVSPLKVIVLEGAFLMLSVKLGKSPDFHKGGQWSSLTKLHPLFEVNSKRYSHNTPLRTDEPVPYLKDVKMFQKQYTHWAIVEEGMNQLISLLQKHSELVSHGTTVSTL